MPSSTPALAPASTMPSQPTSQLTLDFGPPPPPSLDNFAAGNNLECLTALRSLADSLMKGEQPLQRVIYVWGPAGSGKSHLAQALESLQCPRLMVVDDVNRYSKERQRTLFHRFNQLVDKPDHGLVVFGDQPPAHLKKMLPELVSRLSWGMVFGLSPLDDEALADALAHTAKERGLVFGADLSTYLLRHTRRDMASLKAILDGLDRLALEKKRPLTLPLLRSYLQAQAEQPQGS